MALTNRRNKGSIGEQIVDSILGYNNMTYEREHTIINKENRKQRMDFMVKYKDKEYCIEYMGEQHYIDKTIFDLKSIQKNDKLKKEYCLDNGIIFIEISYLENTIESIYKILSWYFKDIKKPKNIELYKEANKFKGNISIENKRKNIKFTGTYGDILNKFKDINESNINKCLNGETDSISGYIMSFEDDYLETIRILNCQERKKNRKNKPLQRPREKTPVVALNVYTMKEYRFDSINECQKELGLTGVYNLIFPREEDRTRISLKGFIFKKVGGEYKHNPKEVREKLEKRKPQKVNRPSVSKRQVYMIDIETGEETKFESIAQAERETGIKGISTYISSKRNRVSLKGKMFRIEGQEYRHSLEEARSKSQKRKVEAYNIETGDKIIGILNEVGRKIGVSGTNISKVLRGKGKSLKGYTFEYK